MNFEGVRMGTWLKKVIFFLRGTTGYFAFSCLVQKGLVFLVILMDWPIFPTCGRVRIPIRGFFFIFVIVREYYALGLENCGLLHKDWGLHSRRSHIRHKLYWAEGLI